MNVLGWLILAGVPKLIGGSTLSFDIEILSIPKVQETAMQGGVSFVVAAALTAGEIYSMVKRPTTLLEILTNLKIALDSNFLLREDFYTEDNLKKFSGTNEILWVANSAVRRQAGAVGFNEILNPVKVGNNTREGIYYSVARIVLESGQSAGSAYISFMGSNPDVSFERIEEVFGKAWQEFPWSPPPHGRIFSAPTHPHGNDRIRYVLDGRHVSRSIVMDLLEDGTLYNATFLEETK